MNLLTLHEVADVMKVSESTVRRIIREGRLKAYKIGKRGQIRVKKEELERYIEDQIVQSGDTDGAQQEKPTSNEEMMNDCSDTK